MALTRARWYNGFWKVASGLAPDVRMSPTRGDYRRMEMNRFISALLCLIPIGLVAAIFILAERSKSRMRKKSFKDLSVKERHDRILREDAERDYWG